jgi:hypothetical protein
LDESRDYWQTLRGTELSHPCDARTSGKMRSRTMACNLNIDNLFFSFFCCWQANEESGNREKALAL